MQTKQCVGYQLKQEHTLITYTGLCLKKNLIMLYNISKASIRDILFRLTLLKSFVNIYEIIVSWLHFK